MNYQDTVKCQKALEYYLKDSQGTLTPVTSSRVVKAREKLKKLTNVQFSDLSTDVYDEMERRKKYDANPDDPNAIKFLPSENTYHPKRNQARQKLAALPNSRFKDLVNDVLHEIGNRLKPQEKFTPIQKAESIPAVLPGELPAKRVNPDLTIDVDKSNGYYQSKQLETKSGTNTPITTQSQIKSTTLVPQKAELTWSSDDESEKDEQDESKDAINRSPSKRYTIATNEVLNEHAPENIKFPVDDEPTTDGLNQATSKSRVPENHIESTLHSENDTLKKRIEELEQNALEKNNELNFLTSKYKNYDEINNELVLLRENFLNQTEELNELKAITDMGHTKQLSVEDSREFDTLKSYLDKVLEENEDLKLKANQLEDLDTKYKSLMERYHSLQEEQESMLNMAVEYQDIKRKYDDLDQKYNSLKSVSEDHEKLQKKYNDLIDQYKKIKESTTIPRFSGSNASNFGSSAAIGAVTGVAAGAVTTAITTGIKNLANKKEANSPVTPVDQTIPETQVFRKEVVPPDDSQLEEINVKLTKLSELPNLYDNYSLYSSTGMINVSLIAKVYASLQKIIMYLNSNKTEVLNENIYDYNHVDPTKLFNLVATYAHNANELNKTIKISTDDSLYSRIEEKKRILKNSISNLLSTTKHFVIYRQILPELVLNAALNDVYFSVCSLVILVKIHANSKSPEEVSKAAHEQHEEFLKDNAIITTTPLAFKTRNLEKSPNQSFADSDVRPLRITQRLASVSSPALENGEIIKPTQHHSRTASPMLKNTSILPLIVASSDELDNVKLNKEKSSSGLNISTIAADEDDKVQPEVESQINEDTSEIYSSVNNSNISLNVSPEKELNIGNKNMITSPVRGKNILDKMKKFDSSVEDLNESMNSNKSTPSKVNVSDDVAKAFDKFGAKRRSIDAPIKKNGEENPFLDTKNGSIENCKTKDPELDVSTSKSDSLRTVTDSTATAAIAAVGAGLIGAAAVGAVSSSHAADAVISASRDIVAGTNESLKSSTQEDCLSDAGNDKTPIEEKDFGQGDYPVLDTKEEIPDYVTKTKHDEIEARDAIAETDPITETDPIVESDPVKTDPIKTDPIKTDPIKTDPIKTDPIKTDPIKTDPIKTDPIKTDVIKTDPIHDTIKTDPIHEPIKTDPINEPIKTDSNTKEEQDPVPKLSLKHPEVEDDFNDYDGSVKAKVVEPSLPSAGSALDLDEKLTRRVSRRLSRRMSRVPQKEVIESPKQGGWEYDPEKYEDEDDEEEEDFDVDNFNTLNPDNTLRELLLYLEHQTVEVIKAIQQTLESIRDPKATKGLLRIGAKEINSVVNQMAEGTSTLMNQSRYVESMGHAKYVVGVLEDCVSRMEALYGEDESKDGEYAGKSFKQRSAGIAFDVARSTKELVKTVEEASLRDEIAVLDSRLNRD